MESKPSQRRWSELSKILSARIKNMASPQIYGRFAQLADEAAEGASDEEYLNQVAEEMRAVRTWGKEAFATEALYVSQHMPKLVEFLEAYADVEQQRMYGTSRPVSDPLIRDFVEQIYQKCAGHFSRFPLLVCATPHLDPAGNVYNDGENKVAKYVVEVLAELVQPPRFDRSQPQPPPQPQPHAAEQPKAVSFAADVPLASDGSKPATLLPKTPPPQRRQPAPEADEAWEERQRLRSREQQPALSRTVRAIPLRDRASRANGMGTPSAWRDE